MENWKMTNEEILELVRFHFEEGGLRDDGSCSEYFGTPEDFIEFALAIYEIALATAIREIANQYQYYQCCKDEGVEDMVVDAQKLYELSYDVEAL